MSTASWPFYMQLAMSSVEQGNLTEAEELCYSALRVAESSDPEGRRLATSLQALAALACRRGRYLRAQHFYFRAWGILKAACGEAAPETAAAMVQVASTCLLQNKHDEAEPLYTEALAWLDRPRSPQLIPLVNCLHGLGHEHLAAGRRVAAVAAYQRALAIQEKTEVAAESVIAPLHKLG